MRNVKIGGVGSVLLGDDGVGPYTVRVLDAMYDFAPGVLVEDLGTPGLDLVVHLAGVDLLILIDSVDNHTPPGTITVYHRDDIMRIRPAVRMDPHSPALTESLMIADMAGGGPKEVFLIGISGNEFDEAHLSPAVQAAVPQVIKEILGELDRNGITYRKKLHPDVPDIWWEVLDVTPVLRSSVAAEITV